MVILETVISFGDCCAVKQGLITVCNQTNIPNHVLISHTDFCCCCNCTLVLRRSQLWSPPTRTLYGRYVKRVWVRDVQLKVFLTAFWMDSLLTGPMKIVSLFPFFSVLLVFYSLSQPRWCICTQTGRLLSVLHIATAAVNLQGLADQANFRNN